MQLNAQATYVLLRAMNVDTHALIMKEHGFLRDAYHLWMALKEKFSKCKNDDSEVKTLSKCQDGQEQRVEDSLEKQVRSILVTGHTSFPRQSKATSAKNKCHRPNEESTSSRSSTCFRTKEKKEEEVTQEK